MLAAVSSRRAANFATAAAAAVGGSTGSRGRPSGVPQLLHVDVLLRRHVFIFATVTFAATFDREVLVAHTELPRLARWRWTGCVPPLVSR